MPEIDLRKIALNSLSFGEFHAKAQAAIQNPQKHFKQQRANANTLAIAKNCMSFGEFHAKMEQQGGEPIVHQ